MIDSNAGLSEAKRALLQQRIRARSGPREEEPVRPRGHDGPAPLAAVQEHLWHSSRLAPGNPVYNEVITIHKDGAFEPGALQAAFNELLRRHQVWRSSYRLVDGEPMQVVHRHTQVELPVLDLSWMTRAEAELEGGRLAAEQARRPFDMENGPLLRPLLVRIAADHHRLYVALHHMIFDGFSVYRVILPELIALYNDAAAGRPPSLPEPAIQYADYATWSRRDSQRAEETRRLEYWRNRLRGVPSLELPLDRPRPNHRAFRGAMEPMRIDTTVANGLRAVSREAGGTLFQTLSAALAIFLQRYSGQDDVVFGTTADQRVRPELESMVGYSLTALVLRAELGDDPAFPELLRAVRGDLLDGLANIVPFDSLVRELRPPRHPGANPIFQVTIMLEPPMASRDPEWGLDLIDASVGSAVGHAKFDLSIELDERPDGSVHGRFIYDRDLFDGATARDMVEHWNALLTGIVADPARRVSELPMLTEADAQRVESWNETDAAFAGDTCVHELVAAQARRTPAACAVVGPEGALSYAELDDRARRLATSLRGRGVRRGAIVGVHMDRSLDMMVALLAILRAGGAYLPLEPDHPSRRLAAVIEDARPIVTITTSELALHLPRGGLPLLLVDDREMWMRNDPLAATDSDADDLAYVLYTSGSTGAPKGVLVEHRALVNQLTWCVESMRLSPDDRLVQKTALGFDASVWELFAPLVCGATVVLLEPGAHRDPNRIASAIHDQRITVAQFVPSMLELYLGDTSPIPESLRLVAVGGERLSGALVQRFFLRFENGVELRNLYGPTEACINATSWRCTANDAVVPIGRPVANTRAHVRDAVMRLVPVGAAGELCLAGVQLARGYLNRPDLTAERFVADPLHPQRRLYRTGDRARWRRDGTLEYLGRRDDQVKIRGNRIELGEIESAIADHAAVGACAVAVAQDRGEPVLVAYFAVRAGAVAPSAGELREHLGDRLPPAMMPVAFVVLDELPRTPAGKLDRRALDRQPWRRESPVAATAPRSDTEQRLAAVWARVLGADTVGVDANFFDLGGHSLMAARLLTEVEHELSVMVPLAAVIEGQFTVAAMAALIDASRDPGNAVPASQQRSEVSAPALFFFHSDESTMFTLRHFMGPLGENQRVVGLLPERVGRRFNRDSSVEELARPLLETIRSIQPSGPYYLAGFSLGALLAYEAASRLLEDGDEVAWLGNLDCETPEVGRRLIWLRSPRGFLRRLLERGPRRAVLKAARIAWRVVRAPLVRVGLMPAGQTEDFDQEGAITLGAKYQVRGNAAPMELFASADVVDMSGEPLLGWERVHNGQITVHPIPGTHISMLKEPYVGLVADIVSNSLRHAQLGAVAPSS